MTESIARSSKELLKKFLSGILVFAFIRLKGVIYIPMLSYFLSKSQVGDVGFLNNIANLVVPILLLNLPDSANRHVLDHQDRGVSAEPVYRVIAATAKLALLLMVLLFAGALLFADAATIGLYAYLLCVSAARAFQKLSVYKMEILQYSKDLIRYNVKFEYLPLIPILAYLALLFDQSIFPIGLSILIVGSLISVSAIKEVFRVSFKNFNTPLFMELFKVSLFLMPALYAQLLMQSSDLIIVKAVLGSTETGDFVVANSIAALFMVVSSGLAFFWYSSVKYMSKSVVRKVVIGMPLALPILSGIVWAVTHFGVNLIQSYFWKEYQLVQLAPVLAMFYIQLAFVQVLSGILYAAGEERVIFKGSLIGLTVNLVMGYLLITEYGLIGAGFSSVSASLVLVAFYIYSIFSRKVLQEES